MSQQTQVTPTSAAKLVEFLAVSDAAMQKAAAAEREAEKMANAVDAVLPQVIDVLVQFGRINHSEREKTAKALKNHATALELLARVAGHRNAEEMSKLGSAAGGPTSAPAAPRIKDSDQRWFERQNVTLGQR